LPGSDGWKPYLPGGEMTVDGKRIDKIKEKLESLQKQLAELDAQAAKKNKVDPDAYEQIAREAAQWAAWDEDKALAKKAVDYGYQDLSLGGTPPRMRSAYEELCRWRLWDRTGGGLMAELGSHQLDASSIFVSCLSGENKHIHPLSVHGVGGRQTFPYDRDAEDHVYCMFEFPAPGYEAPPKDNRTKYGYYDPFTGYPAGGIDSYEQDPRKKIIVTYSSTMGNGFGSYGETVMGSKGTLMLAREQEVMIWPSGGPNTTRVQVTKDGGGATMNSYETGGGPSPAASLAASAASGPVSRGYTEEIEHWAWCIRNPSPDHQPKCTGPIAMGDAIMALTAKLAIRNSNAADPKQRAKSYIEFDEKWFDPNSAETPDGSTARSADEALKSPYA
jgi:predicted dehydrogenase